MFSNRFNSKDDPLLGAVQEAIKDGETRRQAEKLVNEEFGVFSRKAVVHGDLAAYDARLEEAYKCMKEGKPLADKDYDGDGSVESPKDEVWGSRLKAAKKAGKLKEEEQVEEGRMPSSVIKHKQKLAGMTDAEKKAKFAGKSEAELKSMAWRHGYGKDSNEYSKHGSFEKKEVNEEQIDEVSKKAAINAVRGKESESRDSNNLVRLIHKKWGAKMTNHVDRAVSKDMGYLTRKGEDHGTDRLASAKSSDEMRKTKGGKIHKQDVESKKSEIKFRKLMGKASKKPNLPEETQLDELSKKTVRKYKAKAIDYVSDAMAGKKGKEGISKLDNRVRGIENANKRLGVKYEETQNEGWVAISRPGETAYDKFGDPNPNTKWYGRKRPVNNPGDAEPGAGDTYKGSKQGGGKTRFAKKTVKESVLEAVRKRLSEDSSFNSAPVMGKSAINELTKEEPRYGLPKDKLDPRIFLSPDGRDETQPKASAMGSNGLVPAISRAVGATDITTGFNQSDSGSSGTKLSGYKTTHQGPYTGKDGMSHTRTNAVSRPAAKAAPAAKPAAPAPKAAPATSDTYSGGRNKAAFDAAFNAAREKGGSSARFTFNGKEYQAAKDKSEYVTRSKQKDVGDMSNPAPKAKETEVKASVSTMTPDVAAKAGEPPKRPAELNTAPAKSQTDLAQGNPNAAPTKPASDTPDVKVAPGSPQDIARSGQDPRKVSGPPAPVNESVQVGNKTYRIV